MKTENKIYISIILGILSIISLMLEVAGITKYLNIWFFSLIGQFLDNIIYKSGELFPLLAQAIQIYLTFAWILIIFISMFGIWFGMKNLNFSKKKKLNFLALVLHSINLILSISFAWLLFGLARGM